ncbi:hypothetical protein K440DRAFT_152662 [Wilcoxina mikolae CBS 423.85]|nr:hypothetical protein K440DRAFT_152662 [Wilcoxina mikolae CBS 423.85]
MTIVSFLYQIKQDSQRKVSKKTEGEDLRQQHSTPKRMPSYIRTKGKERKKNPTASITLGTTTTTTVKKNKNKIAKSTNQYRPTRKPSLRS